MGFLAPAAAVMLATFAPCAVTDVECEQACAAAHTCNAFTTTVVGYACLTAITKIPPHACGTALLPRTNITGRWSQKNATAPGCSGPVCFMTDDTQLPVTDAAGPSVEIIIDLVSYNGIIVNRTLPFTLHGSTANGGNVTVAGATEIDVDGRLAVRAATSVSGSIKIDQGTLTLAGSGGSGPISVALDVEARAHASAHARARARPRRTIGLIHFISLFIG